METQSRQIALDSEFNSLQIDCQPNINIKEDINPNKVWLKLIIRSLKLKQSIELLIFS